MTVPLVELLAERGIRLRSMRAGRTEKIVCPQCEGGRSREPSMNVTIDEDGEGASWRCHRASCGWSDGVRMKRDGDRAAAGEGKKRAAAAPGRQAKAEPPPPKEYATPVPDRTQGKPKAMYDFFASRAIPADVVDLFGCYVTAHYMSALEAERPCIVFPYVWQGVLRNRKYRPPEKHPQAQDKGAQPTLFNIDAVTSPDCLWWVEGEPDVMAMHTAGYPQTVSLPNGAPDLNTQGEKDGKRYIPLETHAELLDTVAKIVLAGDMDPPGRRLMEELARRLGRHRCWIVTWPEGCKDANDTLIKHGPEGVQAAVEAAQPYPIEGVYRPTPERMLQLRHERMPEVWTASGVPELDDAVRIPSEGRLIVVTGIPNHGKSPFVAWLLVGLARKYGIKSALFSPEWTPWEHHAAALIAIWAGQPFWPSEATTGTGASLTDEQIKVGAQWVGDHFAFIEVDAEKQPPTLDWLLEMGALSVKREGIRNLVLDPWNELEHTRPQNLSETEYIGWALQRCRAFCKRWGCNVWILTHPTKLQRDMKTKEVFVPLGYDISGSANWYNKPDIGLTVHRKSEETEIHVWKVKFQRHGRRAAVVRLLFDKATGRYSSAKMEKPQDEPDDGFGPMI